MTEFDTYQGASSINGQGASSINGKGLYKSEDGSSFWAALQFLFIRSAGYRLDDQEIGDRLL
jgi:hypothetical protein